MEHDPRSVHVSSLATSACDLERATALLDQMASFPRLSSALDEEQRVRLVEMAQELTLSLQTPMERILQHSWAEPTVFAAIETAAQLTIFHLLSTQMGNSIHVTQISERTGADQALLSRLMKHLSAMRVIEETGPDQYRSNNLSLVLSVEKFAAAFPYMRRGSIPGILKLPDYLAANNYINPTDPTNGPFQFANNTLENWFDWAPKQENGVFKDFSNHMGAYNSGRPKWVDPGFYPVREQLIDGFRADSSDEDAMMLVDVGGSLGHDMELFLKEFPNSPGRLVLQDLPDVITQARSLGLNPRIELMEHDFFTPQPIKNARTYYLHSVLHDWPDFKAIEILTGLASAMKPGYSKALIHGNLIPDVDAHWQATALDLIMMGMVSSREGKENEWRHLMETAGLKIVKIWRPFNGAESLIECELA